MKCKRCGASGKEGASPCICGNHSFELGKLMGAVGGFLHGISDRKHLEEAYRSLATRCAGQHCNGCDVCPSVNAAGPVSRRLS